MKKRGRKPIDYKTTWGETVEGLHRKPDGRFRCRKTGREWSVTSYRTERDIVNEFLGRPPEEPPVLEAHDPEPTLRTPLRWFEGKAMFARRIANLLPVHDRYFEPFAGSAAVLFAKPPANLEKINDLDRDVVNFFTVLRNPANGLELQRRLQLTPYAREEYENCKTPDAGLNAVERARRFFVVCRQSFGDHWATSQQKPLAKYTRNIVDDLDAIVDRLREVQVDNLDFRKFLKGIPDEPDVLVYADPPYLIEKQIDRAQHSGRWFTTKDHNDLLDVFSGYKAAKVALSGYDTELYRQRLAHWKRHEFVEREIGAECLWLNW